MMKTEEAFDSQNVVNKLIDVIINEVMKAVQNRIKDPGYEILKLDPRNQEFLDCTTLKGTGMDVIDNLETQDSLNVNSLLSNICYSSFADLSEMCRHKSPLSASSQQGEGDFQSPAIREATAFYRLGLESENPNRITTTDHQDYTTTVGTSPEPAVSTRLSNSEVLQKLHDNLFNISFDDFELNEAIINAEPQSKCNYKPSPSFHQLVQFEGDVDSEILLSRCDAPDNYSRPGGLQHSQKFCHYDNGQGFPFKTTLPMNYNTLVADQNYNSYTVELRECGDEMVEELLSESSQELASVEGESGMTVIDKTKPSKNPFLNCSHKESVLDFPRYSENTPFITTNPVKKMNSIEVVAEVEPTQNNPINWEEALEVQVNVTDPVENFDPRVEEEENENMIQTRQFWTSVGLMTERKINPKYLGPLDLEAGIESIKDLTLVQEKHLNAKPENVVWITSPQDSEETETIQLSPRNIRLDEKVNYLNLSGKTKKEKNKGTFLTRLSKAVSGIFRSKKK